MITSQTIAAGAGRQVGQGASNSTRSIHPALIVCACGIALGALASYAATAIVYEQKLVEAASAAKALKWQVATINNMLTDSRQKLAASNYQAATLKAQLDELASQQEQTAAPQAPAVKPDRLPRLAQPPKEIWIKTAKRPPINNATAIAPRSSAPVIAAATAPAVKASEPQVVKRADVESTPTITTTTASAPSAPNPIGQQTISASLSKLKIAGLDSRGVLLKNGSTIAINQTFPSGERLISVDPSTNKIITDQRVINVTGP